MSLTLTCQPAREGDALVFPYVLRNEGAEAYWVMDAAGSAARAAEPTFSALPDGKDEALFGKLMPPLPEGRSLLFALPPLARRLEPGASLTSRLLARLPLVEMSAYLPDLPVRQHTIAELSAIRLLIAFWPAALAGLAALPLEDGLHRLAGPDLRRTSSLAEACFPVRRLQMLRRTDAFGRNASG